MLIFSDNEKSYVNDIEIEINAIRHSFVSTVEESPNSFKPFAVFFASPSEKTMIITSRPVINSDDYFTAISEMLFGYSSTESTALLLAIDATKEIDNVSYDILEIYMACDNFCTIYSMPYKITEQNKLVWIEDKFNTYTIDKLEKAYDTSGNLHATMEIFEALYLHTHLNLQVFNILQIKTFFDVNKFEYVLLKNNEPVTSTV